MSSGFTTALVAGVALFFPFLYAMKVTTDAFRTSPLIRIVGHYKRGAALWILSFTAVYVCVTGYYIIHDRVSVGASYVWLPLLYTVGGAGPFVWWFVSRQAHAQIDEETFVAAFTLTWFVRRAVRQYLRDRPEGTLSINLYERKVLLSWNAPNGKMKSDTFYFDTELAATRFLLRLYMFEPDVRPGGVDISAVQEDGRRRSRFTFDN